MASPRRPAPVQRKRPNRDLLAELTGGAALTKAEPSDQVLSGVTPPERPQLTIAPEQQEPEAPTADAGNGSVSGDTDRTDAEPDSGGVAEQPAAAVPAQPATSPSAPSSAESEPLATTEPVGRPDPEPADEPAEGADEQGSEPDKPVRPRKVKFTIMMVEDELDRARSAFVHLPFAARGASLSQWVSRAIMDQVRAAEDEYNDGQPWPPLAKGEVPTGRPVGS